MRAPPPPRRPPPSDIYLKGRIHFGQILLVSPAGVRITYLRSMILQTKRRGVFDVQKSGRKSQQNHAPILTIIYLM